MTRFKRTKSRCRAGKKLNFGNIPELIKFDDPARLGIARKVGPDVSPLRTRAVGLALLVGICLTYIPAAAAYHSCGTPSC